jgi:hypothetical protein
MRFEELDLLGAAAAPALAGVVTRLSRDAALIMLRELAEED